MISSICTNSSRFFSQIDQFFGLEIVFFRLFMYSFATPIHPSVSLGKKTKQKKKFTTKLANTFTYENLCGLIQHRTTVND